MESNRLTVIDGYWDEDAVPYSEHWRNLNQGYRRDYQSRQPRQPERFTATKAVLGGVAIVGGIYFVAFWVIPFFKALWAARSW